MEKLLENILNGRIGNKSITEIKYNGEILWNLLDKYVLEYTLDIESTNNDLLSNIISVSDKSYYTYLPEIDNYGIESHSYYSDIEIKLKNGNIVNNLSTKVKDIESIKIFYPDNTFKIRFYGHINYPHKIKRLNYINIKNLTDMRGMFYGCKSLIFIDTLGWDTSNVTDMNKMFYYCKSLTSLDVSNFNTSNVTDMDSMFGYCSSLKSLDVSNFNTSKVTNMSGMFEYCSSLSSLNLSNFDTSKVEDMSYMFRRCNFTTSSVSNFNTSNVTDMSYMFEGCSFKTLNLSSWNTVKVTNMGSMFRGCSLSTSLYVSNFNTSKVTNMSNMFYNCKSLSSLNLYSFDTSNVTSASYMLYNCTATVRISNKWTLINSDISFSGTYLKEYL